MTDFDQQNNAFYWSDMAVWIELMKVQMKVFGISLWIDLIAWAFNMFLFFLLSLKSLPLALPGERVTYLCAL